MTKFIRYAGHRYRRAQEKETTKKPCGKPNAEDPLYQKAQQVLSGAKIKATPVQACKEADGTDFSFSIGAAWSGIEALLTFDYSDAGKLQELILNMCSLSFVAHGDEMIKMVLGTIQTLQRAEFSPQAPAVNVEDKKRTEYIDFLRHYITELLLGAVELPYDDRKEFSAAIEKMGKEGRYPADRAAVMAEGALRISDEDWQDHIVPLVKSQGRQYAATQEMVNSAVMQIIAADEDYTGSADVLTYLDDGDILVGLDVPKPAQSFMFVFQHAAGQNRLDLVDAGFGICGATFSSKADIKLASKLVSAMVDLAVLAGGNAQPQPRQPPPVVVKEGGGNKKK